MTQPNGVAEPNKVADNVAGAKAPATQTPKQDGNPPTFLGTNDLLNEFTPEKKPEPQPVSPVQRDHDRQVREAKFKLQLTKNLKEVEKSIKEGVELEDALVGIPENFKGKIRKIYEGEEIEGTEEQKADPADLVAREVSRQRALDKAQDLILSAISGNGLNIATEDAQASRKSLISDYQRLLKSNSPEEAAKFALFNAGIAVKQATNEAYENGFKQGNMAVPPPGYPGKSQTGQLGDGQVPTAEQIKNMPFEQLLALDQKVSTGAINSSPLISPTGGQGNPNVR